MIVHAGLLALWRGGWRGALIEGPSGAGKSDLALRALGAGFRLVADDRVVLFVSQGRLFGRAPPALEGAIEARGLGVFPAPSLRLAEVRLLARCVPPSEIDRLPPASREDRLGVSLPIFLVSPLEASAPAKLCRALESLGGGAEGDYEAAFPRAETARVAPE